MLDVESSEIGLISSRPTRPLGRHLNWSDQEPTCKDLLLICVDRTITEWNTLSVSVIQAVFVNPFKSRLTATH